ncbi:hypothetical protein CsatB_022251 [Cannabis sativa]
MRKINRSLPPIPSYIYKYIYTRPRKNSSLSIAAAFLIWGLLSKLKPKQLCSHLHLSEAPNLVLIVARRENRLRGISENARRIGAKHVMIIATDVVKEDDCRRFLNETFNLHSHAVAVVKNDNDDDDNYKELEEPSTRNVVEDEDNDNKESEELLTRAKRMSIEIGPSNFASKKKKIKKNTKC